MSGRVTRKQISENCVSIFAVGVTILHRDASLDVIDGPIMSAGRGHAPVAHSLTNRPLRIHIINYCPATVKKNRGSKSADRTVSAISIPA